MDDFTKKEERYDQAWRAGKVSDDITRYIPEKYSDAYYEAYADSDGYWIYLNSPEYLAYDYAADCGIIHEYNIKDLKAAIKTIKKAR